MSKNSTAHEIIPTVSGDHKMTQKELDTHVVRLMLEEPFYAGVLRGVSYVVTDSIPTAGVSTRGCEVTMFWNPGFLSSLTRDQVKGLLKHESMHLAYLHTTDRRLEPHLIHNYATDLAINSDIPRSELPDGGLIPGEEFEPLKDEQLKNMSKEAIDRYSRISAKIAQLPKHKSSEWYFAALMEDQDLADDIESSQGGGESGIMLDDHESWGEMSDEEKELMKGKIKQAVADAVKECDRTGRWGSVGSEVREEIRKLISNEVDWRSLLKKFCGLSRRSTRTTSWSRLNKKYAGLTAGIKRGYSSSIAVYIDQSGSVSKSDLELVFAELASLSKRTTFTTFHFDTSVDVDSESEWKKGRRVAPYRTRCGGTDFQCVTEHANKNSARFDGYLIITDGEAAKPTPSKLKRGWLLVPNTSMMFPTDNRVVVRKMRKAA